MNAPTLLVGLGGIGSKVVARVSRMSNEQNLTNIAFAAMDTDINELRCIKRDYPVIKIIQTSTRSVVGEYLKENNYAKDAWFPVHKILNSKTLAEGAGQVRAISRLALDSAIRSDKMEPLHEAIQSLYKVEEDKPEQALRVIIVSSLVGGTGSGLLLPVALYIRNYLKTHFRQGANIMRGFFTLPEISYLVIKGATERNNLKANAYAALRELDAFLMKSDGTLHERYKDSVKILFPKLRQEGHEEYEVSPYDFCFLFDAQNAEGGKLNSYEQYLDHIANCIYAQSIGPMNKRSNSSEDNTIRKLAKEQGRNRYAGAGVSMLIYPFADIKKLIALKWTKQCISSQWLRYDKAYNDTCIENERLREEGLLVNERDRTSYYVAQIDSDYLNEDSAFSKAIYKASVTFRDGRKSENWIEYINQLKLKIESDISSNMSGWEAKKEVVREDIETLSDNWSRYVDVYYLIEDYKEGSLEYSEEIAYNIAYTLFKGSSRSDDDNKPYKLETYLKDFEGNYIHPNAVRYILTKIREKFEEYSKKCAHEKKTLKESIDSFDEIFDDPNTKEKETVDQLGRKNKKSLLEKLMRRPTAEQDNIKDQYSMYLSTIVDYQVHNAQFIIFSKGISYVSSLIESMEAFYDSLEKNIDEIDSTMKEIYAKYSDTRGSTVRYVCASKKALDKIIKNRPFSGSTIKIDPELSELIYDNIVEYALYESDDDDRKKPEPHRFFTKVFEEGIVKHFEDSVKSDIDLDILSAIKKEAELLGADKSEDGNINNPDELTRLYLVKTINDTRSLACPFIETPMGEAQDPINACTFNKDLVPKKGDISPMAHIINKELMGYGGEPDEDISKYMIIFYKSYYGLRANNLSKFAPPERAETYHRSGGEYYKSYFDLISNINPCPEKSREINPHIDRNWHFLTRLENGKEIYKIKNIRLGLNDDSLIVSNGTDCDNLYEVLDAISSYPLLVKKILERINLLIENDRNEKKTIEDRTLYKYLIDFKLEEPGIGKNREPALSIFDIPLLMKKSSLPDEFYEETIIELLKVILNEVKRYLSKFNSDKTLPDAFWNIVRDQFDKHIETLKKERECNPGILDESLTEKTVDVIVAVLDEYGLEYEEEIIRDFNSIR